jgi:hypothetical protein
MRNLIKEYLEAGHTFEDLENEFAISANQVENLICLNYSQIDSPKTVPIVRQCRGTIIDADTYDIVHYPFFRFYNFEEVPEERIKFNWKNAKAVTKIDGSLFGVFYYNNKWYITTRKQIGCNNMVNGFPLTFGNIFDMAIPIPRDEFFAMLDKNLDYIFELTSQYNMVVTPYSEANIWLIGVRDRNDYKELNAEEYYKSLPESLRSIIKTPEYHSLVDENGEFRGFEEMKRLANECPNPTDEGFVVVDYSSYDDEFGYFPRTKVKNASYVSLHHLRGQLDDGGVSYPNILEIIFKGEQDEVKSLFPNLAMFFDEVEPKFNKFMEELENSITPEMIEIIQMPEDVKNEKENKKRFALSLDKRFQPFLFSMHRDGIIDVKKSIEKCMLKSPGGIKGYFKNLWERYVSKYTF